uniref:2-oxoisovalerate dehydrogenase n=1 Tax=Solanum tuberosum TaxID=4113 RepID=M1C5I3_SOLTU
MVRKSGQNPNTNYINSLDNLHFHIIDKQFQLERNISRIILWMFSDCFTNRYFLFLEVGWRNIIYICKYILNWGLLLFFCNLNGLQYLYHNIESRLQKTNSGSRLYEIVTGLCCSI